jgi:hypothetical protein
MAAAAASAAALMTALCGCSGPALDGRVSADPRQRLAPVQPLGPFDGLADQPADVQTRLQNTQNLLTAQCMRGRGFQYTVAALTAPVDPAATAGAYDLLSPQTAAAQGYGIADNALVDRTNAAAVQRPQPDMNRPGYGPALIGTSARRTAIKLDGGSSAAFNADGCITWALVHLYGPRWNEVYFNVSGISARVQQTVVTGPEWTTAVQRWSTCMNTRYHVHYASPQAARSDVTATVSQSIAGVSAQTARRRLEGDRIGEVALAEQDAACQQRSGLASAAAQAQNRVQSPLMARYEAQLTVYKDELAHAKRTAGPLPADAAPTSSGSRGPSTGHP